VTVTVLIADDAMQAGASGFLLKDTPPEQLIHGICTVARGDALAHDAPSKDCSNHLLLDGIRRGR
jgi:DNA-binding NarL/FixJ family response regulator